MCERRLALMAGHAYAIIAVEEVDVDLGDEQHALVLHRGRGGHGQAVGPRAVQVDAVRVVGHVPGEVLHPHVDRAAPVRARGQARLREHVRGEAALGRGDGGG